MQDKFLRLVQAKPPPTDPTTGQTTTAHAGIHW